LITLLIGGDKLFTENTRESIVEAEMFYVMAYDLLGKEPEDLGPATLAKAENYSAYSAMLNTAPPYFGIPRNKKFLSYWGKVQQRLYDIRHGLNILWHSR